ncbi:putative flavin-containing monooxygenase [Caenibius tardaugens NBRC 16725]|uniref:Putative flavin-containing monooxygenase n=2 Tax=Caenibius TaxID=2827482 RepID=U2YPZ5_9SPHN|nr:NAD(P)/FAD-dependent oxidoreductase [Caenibius tardaugens]GAD50742.1 putative flavin-containing monooxygenase [Caenibius tardaugens NBRC 16725]
MMSTAHPASSDPGIRPDLDVLIVGAGISGISMAAHLGMKCPGMRYAIMERREQLGGTWDLFRYPGIRSDSDMYTLGFGFEPWTDRDAIADGDRILAYLDRVVDQYNIRPNIRLATRVVSADFRADEGQWRVVLEGPDGSRETTARFVYFASGYYDYDAPHDPAFAGRDTFTGTIVHPQFWPQDLDYAGKRVVIIGSGATAVTMIPAMAQSAAHVTMLQRTPTWMAAQPRRDRVARLLQALFPARIAYRLNRRKNIRFQEYVFKTARRTPSRIASFLTRATRKALGTHYTEKDWLPPYGPWEQRLCLIPDGDLFAAIRKGQADVVTDRIERFDRTGIVLESGRHLDADIIVTATGLRLAMGGQVKVTLDGIKVNWRKHFYYRACMFSNVPNLAVAFGYLNAAWTLRADLTASYICDVLNTMQAKKAALVRPILPDDHDLTEDNVYEFSSGYIQRALPLMPKSATALPWRLNQDYREDLRDYRTRPIDDGVLHFESVVAKAREIA